jgi:hypothetical protein
MHSASSTAFLAALAQTVSATLQTSSGGKHFVGGELLVFEDVVVFGMVVFGVLIVVAGFFMKVFVSRLSRFGRSDAHAVVILLLC